jgi:hypothetical protein
MSFPTPDNVGRPRRGVWSRLQSGVVFAAAGFMLGISVLSLAVPLTSVKAVVIKLAMGVVISVFGFLIGLLLSRRIALWGLAIAVAIAIPTLEGIFTARAAINALKTKPSNSSISSGAFSIVLSDIPRPVVMTLPEGFRLAATPDEKAKRERYLNFFRLNPAYKGSYEEVLLKDWSQDNPRPQIVVSTIQAARADQGSIGSDAWAKLKQEFESANSEEIKRLRAEFRNKLRDSSSVGLSMEETAFSSTKSADPNAVILLSRNQVQASGLSLDDLTARKIIYHNGYLITVDVVVAADRPDALNELQRLAEAVRIHEI